MSRLRLTCGFGTVVMSVLTILPVKAEEKIVPVRKLAVGSNRDEGRPALASCPIASAAALEQLWKDWEIPGKVPAVDFSKEIVVFVTTRASHVGLQPMFDDKIADLVLYGESTGDRAPGFRYVLCAVSAAGIGSVDGKPRSEWTFDPLARVMSGRPLNDDLSKIIRLQSDGRRGPDIVLSAEQLAKINFSLGERAPAVYIALFRRARTLDWPQALKAPAYAKERERLVTLLSTAIEQVKKGTSDKSVLQELTESVSALEGTLRSQPGGRSPELYGKASKFLAQLRGALPLFRDPQAANYFKLAEELAAKDRTVADLVEFMKRNGFIFAPALIGDGPAYDEIARSQGDYLKGLEVQKKDK